MSTSNFSRRQFLKLAGLSAGALMLPPPPPDEAPRRVEQLGRAVRALYIYDKPAFDAKQLNLLTADTVFNILGAVESDDKSNPNRMWHRVRRGFVHSAPVQLVRWDLQPVTRDVPPEGFIGEVTVPYTETRVGPGPQYKTGYRYYYSTTYWVKDTTTDETGAVWYQVHGDLKKDFAWARGEHIRRVRPEELTPLSPDVQNKRIEVNLDQQTIRCFENDKAVLESRCSTGIPLRRENGRLIFGTPAGEWQVIRKRASRHMQGDLADVSFYDLPGVPWCTYIHWWGVAIHGTYWHNDFGRPRSHGCINVPSEVAKWVYRWTTPTVPPNKEEVEARGTPVTVLPSEA